MSVSKIKGIVQVLILNNTGGAVKPFPTGIREKTTVKTQSRGQIPWWQATDRIPERLFEKCHPQPSKLGKDKDFLKLY